MFGKLLKHELRHTARYHFIILGISLVASAVMGFSLLFDTQGMFSLAILPLALIAFAVIIVSLVSVIRNFYDTIFSRQGYLTMTLPVKGSQLLISKVLVSFFWICVSYVAAFLPFFFIFLHVKKQVEDFDEAIALMIEEFVSSMPSGGSVVSILIFLVFTTLCSLLTYVGYIYFSVTLANTRLLQGHPKLFGALVFGAVHFVSGLIVSLTEKVAPLSFGINESGAYLSFKSAVEMHSYMEPYLINEYIIKSVVAVALLVATGYIIEHKINIK